MSSLSSKFVDTVDYGDKNKLECTFCTPPAFRLHSFYKLTYILLSTLKIKAQLNKFIYLIVTHCLNSLYSQHKGL